MDYIDLAIKRQLNKNFINVISFDKNKLIISFYDFDFFKKDFVKINKTIIDLEKELYKICKKYFIENEKELKKDYSIILNF